MASTRFNGDAARIIKSNQQSTGPGRWVLDVPGNGETPSFALRANRGRWILHGVASFPVWQTPMNCFDKSSSVNPMALYIALCGALLVPSTTFLLEISTPCKFQIGII